MEPENWGYHSYWNYKAEVGNVIVAALGKKIEGSLRDFDWKRKKNNNGRERSAAEFPILP